MTASSQAVDTAGSGDRGTSDSVAATGERVDADQASQVTASHWADGPPIDGTLTITRVTSNQEPFEYMNLDLRLPHSRDRIRVEMSMHDFAMALTGRAGVEASVRWSGRSDSQRHVQAGWWSPYVLSGKVHDHPTEGDRRKHVNPAHHRGCEPVFVAVGSGRPTEGGPDGS